MNKEEEIEELEIEIQNILAPYFIILDGRDDTQENMELIRISKNISRKVSENYVSKAEVKEKIEKQIKHYEELKEEIRSMRESNRNETRIIDSEQTEFAKALCGHYECLMCGNMVNGFNKYCPCCGRINKKYE